MTINIETIISTARATHAINTHVNNMSILPGDELDELLTVDKTLFVVKDVFLI
jgi:hypothetical protein